MHEPDTDRSFASAKNPEREQFDIPASLLYLNCASLAPRLHAVTDAGHRAVERMGAPWSVPAADWFDEPTRLQGLFASIIGAPKASVALVPSVSYGVAVAARNIPVGEGDNIVVLDREYPSNYYSWVRLARERGAIIRVARQTPGLSFTQAIVASIDRHTAVVAVPQNHWTDGTIVDLEQVGEVARRHGAALVVDASQSLGAYPLDVARIQPDFLITVGYKWLLGPYGLAYMYVAERWHAEGVPLEESWLHRCDSDNFASLVDYTDVYRPGAGRFGQGESPQFYLLPMAIAALSQIKAWGTAHIQGRLRAWTDELAVQARAIGMIVPENSRRVGHLIGLKARNGLPADLTERLKERDIHVAIRGNNIRVAPHLHCTSQDIDRLIAALKEHIGE
jgi:selenocysteine lyase/cysteine desulfurase